MKTAIATNLQPDRYDGEKWPTLVLDMPDGARERSMLGRSTRRKEGRSAPSRTTILRRDARSDLIRTTTQPEAGSTGHRHLEAVSLIDIAYARPDGPNRRSNG